MMKNTVPEPSKSVQEEMEELKARLGQNAQVLQNSAKQDESHNLMSLIIKSTATFEKD